MPRGEGTGWVKKAKRRDKLDRMAALYPEDAVRYIAMQDELTAEILAAGVCVLCGREIRSADAVAAGLGKDCVERLRGQELPRWLIALGIALPE